MLCHLALMGRKKSIMSYQKMALQLPAEVVTVKILNSLEDASSVGKPRPAVLIERIDGHWLTMGLTRQTRYKDGTPRTPIPDFRALGLDVPGYFWGWRLTAVSALDLGVHIGWADVPAIEAILRLLRKQPSGAVIAELLRRARASVGAERGSNR